MTERSSALAAKIIEVLGDSVKRVPALPDELALEVAADALLAVAAKLRDAPGLQFDTLIDVAGVDYEGFGGDEWKTTSATRSGFSRGVNRLAGAVTEAPVDTPLESSRRFAVAYQLLSVTLNQRLRLRVYCQNADEPIVDSLCDVWASANWFEREAFDLFGIFFRGHPDLRRILTDYGFIGHPFRKDFPLIGNVEVRYDPAQQRVVYEPVSIEARTLVPRVIRDDPRWRDRRIDHG